MKHLFDVAAERGFSVTHQTSKVTCFVSSNGSTFYLLTEQTRDGNIALATHPHVEPEDLRELGGNPEVGQEYLHSSNLTKFPKRLHRGIKPIHYGRGVRFRNSIDYSEFLKSYVSPA